MPKRFLKSNNCNQMKDVKQDTKYTDKQKKCLISGMIGKTLMFLMTPEVSHFFCSSVNNRKNTKLFSFGDGLQPVKPEEVTTNGSLLTLTHSA